MTQAHGDGFRDNAACKITSLHPTLFQRPRIAACVVCRYLSLSHTPPPPASLFLLFPSPPSPLLPSLASPPLPSTLLPSPIADNRHVSHQGPSDPALARRTKSTQILPETRSRHPVPSLRLSPAASFTTSSLALGLMSWCASFLHCYSCTLLAPDPPSQNSGMGPVPHRTRCSVTPHTPSLCSTALQTKRSMLKPDGAASSCVQA